MSTSSFDTASLIVSLPSPIYSPASSPSLSRLSDMEDFPPPPDQDESSLFQHAAAGKDGWPARTGQSMSLREQGNTIDRLSKENFDLKVRVHFLNEELGRRSDEGIQAMSTENAELKTDRQKLQRETQGLRRQVRDLEKLVEHQKSAFKADKQKLHDDSEAVKHRVHDLEHQLETQESEFKLENRKLHDDGQGLRQKVYELENQLEVQKAASKLDKQKLQEDSEGLRQKVYGLENQLEAQKAMSKTDKQKLQHDSQELRQIVYDLEHQLEEKRLAELAHAQAGARPVSSEIDAREERVSALLPFLVVPVPADRARVCGETCSMARPRLVSSPRTRPESFVPRYIA
jgi:chromosome segregation ATPase